MPAPVIQISAARAARARRSSIARDLCALSAELELIALRQLRINLAWQRVWLRTWWGV